MEIAICSGGRSTTEGMMKVESAALSATFTGMRSERAAADTASFTAGSSVAAMAISAPTRSPGWKRLFSILTSSQQSELREAGAGLRRDHRHADARAQQGLGLEGRDRAAAHHDAGPAMQGEKSGEVGAIGRRNQAHGATLGAGRRPVLI